MAELEIDQSNLPRVNEVRQSFAVREDSVLAHNLQEQEIEQYYSSNVQKSQLVQGDIRVARRLQGEEEQQQQLVQGDIRVARRLQGEEEEQQQQQQHALRQHPSRHLEEQDSEYARLIQEELRRCAEESRSREQEDEEIAKRIQEEEEQRARGRGQEELSDGSTLPPPQPREGCLDLGALQQVLQDQELALRLQEEEERRARRGVRETARNSYHEGDFRVAQVAQDEEIARFIQKQEIKSRRRSRELDGPASWREHREMISHPERTAPRDPQGQGKRRDSEDLPSPTEEHSPENQPPSPISDLTQTQVIRNIAEELDPTFRAPGPGNPTLKTGPAGPSCPSVPVPPSGPSCVLEEPTFIPPTKRQPDKSGRKPKEKKENCKQQ